MHGISRHTLAVLLPLLLCVGCASTGEAVSPEPEEKGLQARPLTNCWDEASHADRVSLSKEASAGVTIQEVRQDGSTLHLTITYAGGCAPHDFDLCWDGLFQASSPLQVELLLLHEPHGDSCKKRVTEERVFDLSPLKREGVRIEPCRVPGYENASPRVSCQVPSAEMPQWPWGYRPR